MKELKKEEMLNVDGGASALLVTTIVGAVITFVVSILHGYSNPKKCNN